MADKNVNVQKGKQGFQKTARKPAKPNIVEAFDATKNIEENASLTKQETYDDTYKKFKEKEPQNIEKTKTQEKPEIIIRYKTEEGCERCTWDAYVPHYNCLYYHGRFPRAAAGHSQAHCTASACY